MRAAVALAALAACGPELHPSVPSAVARDTLVAASGDEHAIRKLLRDDVMNGGLWFADPECVRQFPAPGPIHEDRLDAFARCLATLHFHASAREDPFIDVAVMTYEPGIEIEALVVEDGRGRRLGWIGYSARRDLADALPTVTPEALEGLRSAGDRDGPVAAGSVPDGAYAWLKVCLDAEGTVTKVRVRETTSLDAGRVFAAAAEAWRFRPFLMGGKPLPVCAMERLAFPAKPAKEVLPMPVAAGEDETVVVAPKVMEVHRISGEKVILPSDRTKVVIQRKGIHRIIGALKLCVDETGRVARVKPLRSTGFPDYDALLVQKLLQWRYEPYVDKGQPVAVCTAVTFIYSQH